jgi:hypothetical protein
MTAADFSGFYWHLPSSAGCTADGLTHGQNNGRAPFWRLALRYYRAAFTLIAVLTFLPVLVLAARLPDKSINTIRFPLLMLDPADRVCRAGAGRRRGTASRRAALPRPGRIL